MVGWKYKIFVYEVVERKSIKSIIVLVRENKIWNIQTLLCTDAEIVFDSRNENKYKWKIKFYVKLFQ